MKTANATPQNRRSLERQLLKLHLQPGRTDPSRRRALRRQLKAA